MMVSLKFRVKQVLRANFYSNVANVGGLQIPGVKGEVVVLYFEPLTTQNLTSSGVPRGFKGKQHGKNDTVFKVHYLRLPENGDKNSLFNIISVC